MEHGVIKLASGLDKSRFEQRLCILRGCDQRSGWLEPFKTDLLLRPNGDQTRRSPLFWLMKMMSAYRPHIVHSRNWGSIEAVLAAYFVGVPVIIHSEHGYEVEMLKGLPLRRRALRRVAYSCADAVCTVSNELREFHAKQAWSDPRRIQVLYNGVDTDRFSPDASAGREFRQKLGFTQSHFVIGAVGRLVPIKAFDVLLQAAAGVMEQCPEARVLLVGEGPERARLQQLVAKDQRLQGRVVFTGARECVPELMNSMDVFVMPSLQEGISNTLLEAMSTGIPVIASRVGGNPEIIPPGRSDLLLNPRDVKTFMDRICELRNNPGLRHQMGADLRQHVIGHFGLTQMLGRYRDLYLDLLQKNRVLVSH